MVDVDHFGKAAWTNSNLDSFLPPAVSGEHPARFWWRYLTAFQFRVWRGIVAHRLRGGDRRDGIEAFATSLRASLRRQGSAFRC